MKKAQRISWYAKKHGLDEEELHKAMTGIDEPFEQAQVFTRMILAKKGKKVETKGEKAARESDEAAEKEVEVKRKRKR